MPFAVAGSVSKNRAERFAQMTHLVEVCLTIEGRSCKLILLMEDYAGEAIDGSSDTVVHILGRNRLAIQRVNKVSVLGVVSAGCFCIVDLHTEHLCRNHAGSVLMLGGKLQFPVLANIVLRRSTLNINRRTPSMALLICSVLPTNSPDAMAASITDCLYASNSS